MLLLSYFDQLFYFFKSSWWRPWLWGKTNKWPPNNAPKDIYVPYFVCWYMALSNLPDFLYVQYHLPAPALTAIDLPNNPKWRKNRKTVGWTRWAYLMIRNTSVLLVTVVEVLQEGLEEPWKDCDILPYTHGWHPPCWETSVLSVWYSVDLVIEFTDHGENSDCSLHILKYTLEIEIREQSTISCPCLILFKII